jgi:hypothetical protein
MDGLPIKPGNDEHCCRSNLVTVAESVGAVF